MRIFKTFFVLVVGIISMLSCSKDDEPASIEIQEDEKLLGSFSNSGGSEFSCTISYNQDKTVSRLNYDFALLFDFDYLDNRIASIEFSGYGQLITYAFAYDAQGYIASFRIGETLVPINYNPLTNSYKYINQNNEEITITLTQEGDIRQFISQNRDNGVTNSLVINYNNDKNGAMLNSNAISIYVWMIVDSTSALVLSFPFSKRPVESISVANEGTIIFENTYDSQGFVKSLSFGATGGITNNATYNYNAFD